MFSNEAAMLPCVADHLAGSKEHSKASWILVSQHKVDNRIPDLVLARINPAALEERIEKGLTRSLRRSEIAVMRALRTDRVTTIRTVATRASLASVTTDRILRQLEPGGYVTRVGNRGYVRNLSLQPLVCYYVSVEAKLSDWRRALSQAAAHASFAAESYVAFDATYSGRFSRARRYYEATGVGLLSMDGSTGRCRTLLQSRRNRTDRLSRALADERLLSALVSGPATALPETRLPNAVAPSADLMTPRPLGAVPRIVWRLLSGPSLSPVA